MTKTLTILEADFALVAGGNASRYWIVDGPDVHERAKAAMSPHWRVDGVIAPVFDRQHLFCLMLNDDPYALVAYTTREAAELGLARHLAI